MAGLIFSSEPDRPWALCCTFYFRIIRIVFFFFFFLNLVVSSLLQAAVSAPAEPADRPRGPGQSATRHSQLVPCAPSQALPAGGLHRPPGQQEAPDIPFLKQSGGRAAQSQTIQAAEPQRHDGRQRPEELPGPAEAFRLPVCRVPAGRRGGQKAGTGSRRSRGTRGFGGATAGQLRATVTADSSRGQQAHRQEEEEQTQTQRPGETQTFLLAF